MRNSAILLLSLFAAACNAVEAEQSHIPDQMRPDSTVPDDGFGDIGTGEISSSIQNINGTWVLYLEDHFCLEAVGSKIENIVWSWYLVDFDTMQVGSGPELTLNANMQVCHEELSPLILNLVTMIPDSVAAIQPIHRVPAYLMDKGQGGKFMLAELVERWGLDQSLDPLAPVPTVVNDSNVVDQDGDGKPGVSFDVVSPTGSDLCDVYVVQRKRVRLNGNVIDSSRIEGEVWSELNKVILEATSPLCKSNADMYKSPAGATFHLVRVDGREGGINLDINQDGTISCEEIIRAKEALMSSYDLTMSTPDNTFCQ